jgi:iron complex outermembrane receptor protein
MLNGGITWQNDQNLYFTTMFNITSRLPLNDANTEYADRYGFVNTKVGYSIGRLDIYGGCNNLFDETYSLGNDINAFGGRYYNAAPDRNFYVGLKLSLKN